MKKYLTSLFAVIMIAATSVCLLSCGNDGEEGDGPNGESSSYVSMLQGTWEFQTGTETVMGMTITMSRNDLSSMKSQMSSMMGGTRVEIWDETLKFTSSKVNDVKYTISGSTLKLDGQPDGFTVTIKSLTSSTLVLHEVIDVDKMAKDLDMEDEMPSMGKIVADIQYSKK